MKKIVLTLGIFLSAYATYAIGNNSNELEIESNNSIRIVEEDDNCYRIVDHYDHAGNWIGVSVYPC
ncbi:hypothetical protein [Aquimarina macrocephali]|uniref:hypothetical protein n=1 Tax=Aquimarina macrocephali TaxID=666563 RepID=UPI0004648B7B|nr:hypothetical protein [Aquimarina macrocephali]